jgi:glycosyltransferase involved in cell wall biosynthesis
MKICILVSNDMMNDPRVSRHAEALGQIGHRVLVVCSKSYRTSLAEQREFYSIRRVRLPYQEIKNRIRHDTVRQDGLETEATKREVSAIQRMVRLFVRLIVFPAYRLIVFPTCLNCVLWKAGREFNAELYITNDLDTLLAGILCSSTSRILLHDAHELWPDQWTGMKTYSRPEIAWFQVLESMLFKRPDVITTVNPFIAEVLERRYKIRRPEVILNVPEMEESNPMKSRLRPHAQKVVLYQGSYARHRGLENMIRACEFLEKDVTLVLRGYGPNESQLRKIAKPFKNCRFERPVPMKELVEAASETADIGIVSYVPVNMNNYLASPNKLFEYIQAGLPVLSSDLPFLRQIIVENNIGYVFNPHSPNDIARVINKATRDDVLSILRGNVLKIQKQYSWNEEKKKLVYLVHSLEPRQTC